mgnify:CR=1 FL=1
MGNTKLSEEELQQLRDFQRKDNEMVFALGQLEVRKIFLEKQKSTIQRDYQSLIQKQDTLGKELQEKYGDGSIDLEKGEFVKSE